MSGIVSATLEAEVSSRIAAQGIVVWLDKDGQYTPFVDALKKRHDEGDYPYPVLAYRGSFLELMLALERHGSGLDPEPILIHLPGYGQSQSLTETPLLELYKAGTEFKKALPTLVSEAAAGRVTPAELDALLASPTLTLAEADARLAEDRNHPAGGFAELLEGRGLTGVVDSLFEHEKKNQALAVAIPPGAAAELASYLLRHTGMSPEWLTHACGRREALSVAEVGDAWAGYLLAVEYVSDLERAPRTPALVRLRELPKPLIARCLDLCKHLRAHHADAYAGLAADSERLLGTDKDEARAEDLGKIDTFAFEEEKIREAATLAAQEGRWAQALTWAKQRSGVAFWLDRDLKRRWEWTLIEHAAAVGVAIERAGSPPAEGKNLAEAVDYYCQKASPVDAAHRHFEQKVWQTPHISLLRPNELLVVHERVRSAYREWADALARSFARSCRRYGALPDDSLQQRTLFEQVVLPLSRESEKIVVFLIDAFRYEMAKDLEAEMKGAGVTVELSARLAELPTVTEVGMNVLAPVVTAGRLSPVVGPKGFGGFRAGEYTVDDPASRARKIGDKVEGGKEALLLKLEDARTMKSRELQKLVKDAPRVIVVHSLELDNAGEKGFGPATFQKTLQDIREAWSHLSQAGLKSFVFTADHGFLLQDRTVSEKPFDRPGVPDRRYVLEDRALAAEDMLNVSLSSLGYDLPGEKYLLFREDTAVWRTTRPGAPFVHGGNSLQERVIPVLVVRRQRERGGSDTVYEVQAEALEDILGRRRLKLKLRLAPNATGALAFTGSSLVTLGLRAKDRPDVTTTIADVEGTAVLQAGLLRVPAKDEWSTVYFQLDGSAEERVQVEIFHPDAVEKITPATALGWFDVTRSATRSGGPPPAPEGKSKAAPATIGIEDEGFRRVFEHIDRYGSINELEMVAILGDARRVRAFSRQHDELVKRVRFRVRTDTTGTMKCYVKEQG